MVGVVTKYSWQFRRPFPQHCNVDLDTWQKAPWHTLASAAGSIQVEICSRPEYMLLCVDELRETAMWLQENVDWKGLRAAPGSMLIPTMRVPESAPAAVPEAPYYYVRSVLTISFPALCWMLRHYHTAEEIHEAWLNMPIVKPGTSNRAPRNSNRGRKRNNKA